MLKEDYFTNKEEQYMEFSRENAVGESEEKNFLEYDETAIIEEE